MFHAVFRRQQGAFFKIYLEYQTHRFTGASDDIDLVYILRAAVLPVFTGGALAFEFLDLRASGVYRFTDRPHRRDQYFK